MDSVFLSSFSHDVHLGFADAIDATVVSFRLTDDSHRKTTTISDAISSRRWPDADVYVLEGSATLYAATARKVFDNTPVIYLGADRGMYALSPACEWTGRSRLTDAFINAFGSTIVPTVARRVVDGVISVSDFIADYARLYFGPAMPIRIAHPYIDSDVFETLGEVEPNLKAPVAVTIGRSMRYKGIHRLVDAWPAVREAHPDAELHIVGPGDHPAEYDQVGGVTVRGYLSDLSDAFEEASLFVQPSMGDAFPVSTLEAMRAGVPPLVTLTTGTRSEARAIDGRLVVDSSTSALASGIVNYFDREVDERHRLSKRARERGTRFDEKSRKAAFRTAFEDLFDEIASRN